MRSLGGVDTRAGLLGLDLTLDGLAGADGLRLTAATTLRELRLRLRGQRIRGASLRAALESVAACAPALARLVLDLGPDLSGPGWWWHHPGPRPMEHSCAAALSHGLGALAHTLRELHCRARCPPARIRLPDRLDTLVWAPDPADDVALVDALLRTVVAVPSLTALTAHVPALGPVALARLGGIWWRASPRLHTIVLIADDPGCLRHLVTPMGARHALVVVPAR